MPGRDGTGPRGTYQNCMPAENEPMYGRGMGRGRRGQGMGRGRGNQGRMPGAGGRGRGRMNRFYDTNQSGWQRDEYQIKQPLEEESKGIMGLLEKILKKLEEKE